MIAKVSAGKAHVVALADGRAFISIKFSDDFSLTLNGFGVKSSAYARAIAAELLRAADELDERLHGSEAQHAALS